MPAQAIVWPTKHDEAWRYTNVSALVEAVQGTPSPIKGTAELAAEPHVRKVRSSRLAIRQEQRQCSRHPRAAG